MATQMLVTMKVVFVIVIMVHELDSDLVSISTMEKTGSSIIATKRHATVWTMLRYQLL